MLLNTDLQSKRSFSPDNHHQLVFAAYVARIAVIRTRFLAVAAPPVDTQIPVPSKPPFDPPVLGQATRAGDPFSGGPFHQYRNPYRHATQNLRRKPCVGHATRGAPKKARFVILSRRRRISAKRFSQWVRQPGWVTHFFEIYFRGLSWRYFCFPCSSGS